MIVLSIVVFLWFLLWVDLSTMYMKKMENPQAFGIEHPFGFFVLWLAGGPIAWIIFTLMLIKAMLRA